MKRQWIATLLSILVVVLPQVTSASERFRSLSQDATVIVRARITKVDPGTTISQASPEYRVFAEVFESAKGDLSKGDRLSIVIRLPAKDARWLGTNPLGMTKDGDFILFLEPRIFSADKKRVSDYRFTEIPLGCLPHDFYTWKLIERAIEER